MSEYHDTDTGEVFEPQGTYRRSDDIAELFAALAKAQGQFEMAERAGENEGFKRGGKPSTYATLAAALEATKEGRVANGLAVIQIPSNGNGNNIVITTLLGHSSGQWIESTFWVAPQQFTAQGAGSVITYLRRYTFMAILGIAPEDDDGSAAVVQPSAPVTRGATRTATPRPSPANKPAPNGNENARPGWIAKFLELDSYEIDPKKVGSWSAWEKHYLAVAAATETFEQYAKLEDDNKEHANKFVGAVKREVFDDFLKRRNEISAKYFTNDDWKSASSDPTFVDKADAETILQT